MIENTPTSTIMPIDLFFGACNLAFLNNAIAHIIIPHKVNLVPANIRMLGISLPLIEKALYPILMQGNNEPQSIITLRESKIVFLLLITPLYKWLTPSVLPPSTTIFSPVI